MHFLLFSTLADFVCLFTTVLTAADQVYCMCCADRRECEQDPTCCTDGCCRMRPWCITHQTCYPLYIRPGGHACCCRRRRLAAAWQLLRVTARRTYVFNLGMDMDIDTDTWMNEWMNKSQQRPWMYQGLCLSFLLYSKSNLLPSTSFFFYRNY